MTTKQHTSSDDAKYKPTAYMQGAISFNRDVMKSSEELRKTVNDLLTSHFDRSDVNLVVALIKSRDEQREREIVEFATDVICQWGYEPSPGVFTSGGLSILETAFVILKRNGLLNKQGHYDTNPPSNQSTKKGKV